MTLPAMMLAAAALHDDDWMAAHDRLDTAMFWVGALFAFTPVLIGIAVGAVIWWHRRKQRGGEGLPPPAPLTDR